MTWQVKTRGAESGLIVADYRCPEHGMFELTVDKPAPDFQQCPRCGCPVPWAPSSPRIKHQLVLGVHRGKSDPPPFAEALDTEPLADGMPLAEWKVRRAKIWNDHDYAEFKKEVG